MIKDIVIALIIFKIIIFLHNVISNKLCGLLRKLNRRVKSKMLMWLISKM